MNDSQNWTQWIAEHGPQLVMFARRWTADHAAAEDLVQEAFVRFWRTQDGVRDPLAYLYLCVRRTAIDADRRQRQRQRREEIAAREQSQPQFACPIENEERRQQIETALAALPHEQAEVVVLKVWSNLTFAQIAEVTASAAGTVASRYRYALARLKEQLQESVPHD